MTTFVFGHKAPDTDATGSAIIWAWYLNEVRGTEAAPKLLGEPNAEALFVLDRWSLDKPNIIEDVAEGQSVVVVDTNNAAELPPSINDANVTEIIDHHLLAGNLKTKSPINITVRPVACTATILYDLMGADAAKMPDAIKGTMLSCILSDTLEFRSPTTTDVDRDLALKLADELGLDASAYAAEMFAAKSDVSSYSNTELLRMDSKLYEVDSTKFRVSTLETTTPDTVLSRKAGLKEDMVTVAEEDGVDHVLFFVVDILNEEATLLIQDEQVRAIAEKSFTVQTSGDAVVLPGVVSRKKQMIPAIKV